MGGAPPCHADGPSPFRARLGATPPSATSTAHPADTAVSLDPHPTSSHSMDLPHADLDEAQRNAVAAEVEALEIIGGAGTGKTTVVAHRIVRAYRDRAEGADALRAVTVSAAGAARLRRVLHDLAGAEVGGHLGRTVQSLPVLCDAILRSAMGPGGRPPPFTVVPLDESERLVGQLLRVSGIDRSTATAAVVRARIAEAKGQGWSPAGLRAHATGPSDYIAADIYVDYQQALHARHTLDADDLVIEALAHLRALSPTVGDAHKRFPLLVIDEDAPIRPAERALIEELTLHAERWVHAFDPALRDVRDAGGPDREYVLRASLRTNHRSQRTIERALAALADRPTDAASAEGAPPTLLWGATPADEASNVARALEEAFGGGLRPSQAAIVVPSDEDREPVLRALADRSIPAHDGGFRRPLAAHRASRAVLAYLRAVVNPRDAFALATALQTPRRGVGATSLERLHDGGGLDGIRTGAVRLHAKAQRAVEHFLDLIETARSLAGDDVVAAAGFIVDESGLETDFQREHTLEAKSRGRQVRAVVQALAAWADGRTGLSVLAGFTTAATFGAVALPEDAPGEAVAVLTPEALADGSFDWLAVVGLAEGSWPRAGASVSGERRRLYRTCSRARDRLVLSYALSSRAYGARAAARSRFLDQIVAGGVPIQSVGGEPLEFEPPESGPDGAVTNRTAGLPRRPSLLEVEVDQAVVHPRFGRGVVRAVDSLGARATATIAFEKGGIKRIVVAHARLQPAPSL